MGFYKTGSSGDVTFQVLMILTTVIGQLAAVEDGYVFLKEANSSYKIHPVYKTWADAKKTCSLEGAVLFTPENTLEENLVLDFWNETLRFRWLLYNNDSAPDQQTVKYIKSRPIWELYNSWHPEEQSDDLTEKYVVLLNGDELTKEFPFVCKRKQERTSVSSTDSIVKTKDVSFASYIYINHTQNYYKIHTDFKNWKNAKATCADEKATLFYPENKCECDAVLTLWHETQSFRKIFIGISSTSESFETVDGYDIQDVYNNWNTGEPNNNRGQEECVVLMRNGTLNDENCKLNLPYICKKKGEVQTGDAVCENIESASNSFRKDYKFIKDTHSFYKIHTIPRKWLDAKEVCAKEGASMFFPENECEVKAVTQFWKQTQPRSPMNRVTIGISRSKTGKLETLDGRSVDEVYHKWRPGEPSNRENMENCVLLYTDGTFNDDNCDVEVPFICRKKDDSHNSTALCNKVEKEKPLQITTVALPENLVPLQGYQFLKETECAYKKHPVYNSWKDASDTCESEGASLFYPANQCEAQYVLALLNDTLSYRWIFASITFRPTKEMFNNVQSHPIWELYNSWDLAEIKNKKDKTERPYILLNDLQVVTSFPFMCKKKINPVKEIHCKESDDDKKDKGYTFISDTEYLYKVHTNFKTWTDANQTCIKEDASLFYPKTDCEADAILKYWKQTQYFRRIFIGLTSARNGSFVTVDGYPAWNSYNTWRIGEPNNQYDMEECVALVRDSTLNDVRCGLKLPFICKKNAENRTGDAKCDKPETGEATIFRKDYTYLINPDSAYKIHTLAATWDEAKAICESEGAEFFFPENECELNSVVVLWQRSQFFTGVFVGISSVARGYFETVDGRPIWSVYNHFAPGEPNNVHNEEKCLEFSRSSFGYNDVQCNYKHRFICKKKIGILENKSKCKLSEKQNTSAATFRNDYKYFEETASFYKIHTIERDWFDAKELCTHEEAELFYPENECEANVIRRWWTLTQPSSEVFIGVSSPAQEYKTIDGRPLEQVYHKWDEGEPVNEEHKTCLLFDKRSGYLRNGMCDKKTAFICRKKSESPGKKAICNKAEHTMTTAPQPPKEDLHYTQLPDTKHYYKMHKTLETWEHAKDICASETASLFFPENECEKNAVINFWNKTNSGEHIFVGISSFTPGGEFETIDGRLAYDLYNNWTPGEPNNAGGNEGCGVLRIDGTLNDEVCIKKLSFICKKENPAEEESLCNKGTQKEDSQMELFRTDYRYFEQTKSFYKIHTTLDDWFSAKKKCALEDSILYYPENEIENDVVLKFWNETMQPVPFFYVGASDLLSKGDFETVDGHALVDVYHKWGPSEPNNSGDREDCVVLRTDGTFNDDSCNKKFPFVCKKSLASTDWNEHCNIADTKYVYNRELNKCYKFHEIPKSWTDAYAECTSEQSYLAIMNSQAEVDFMVKFTDNYVRRSHYNGDFLRGIVHLGYHNRDGKGWRTVKGQPLFLSGYDRWDLNQPDGGTSEPCGSMFLIGTLNDVGCSQKSFFICEHDIKK